LIDTLNYINFYNLTLASQVQLLFALMHILSNSWCDWEYTGVLQCAFCKIQRKFLLSWDRRYHQYHGFLLV